MTMGWVTTNFVILSLSAAAATAVLTMLAVRVLLSVIPAGTLLDEPNHRSLHRVATPRIGGIAMALALLPCVITLASAWSVLTTAAGVLGIAILPVFAISARDDFRPVAPGVRLAVHFAACAGWLAWVTLSGLPVSGVVLVVLLPAICLAMVWMLNLYNFMDGMDGLATGMGAIGFAAVSCVASLHADRELATIAALIAGGSFGVWVWNRPPARVFLGDAGAASLGFLAAALGVWGWQRGSLPFWVVPAVFSPFLIDASLTLAMRVWRGGRPWEAHRDHLYQRLVLAGMPVTRVLVAEYVTMLAVSGAVCMVIRLENAILSTLVLGILVLAQVVIRIGLEGSRRLDAGAADPGCEGL